MSQFDHTKERFTHILHWLAQDCGLKDPVIRPLSGDASFRRYFRIEQSTRPSLILMDAPPGSEDVRPFVEIAARLAQAGLHPPEVKASDIEQGFLLLEDLGDEVYLNHLDAASAPRLYGDALSALVVMQACVPTAGLPDYDAALLRFEMELFRDWLCFRHLGLNLTDTEHAVLDTAFHHLTQNALRQPQYFVHRDYHSRNLTLCPQPPQPGILDFQDAVRGPICYDLVSLLRDAYIRWPSQQIDFWLEGYAELAVQSGLLSLADKPKIRSWFDLMGAQRHIKVAGIFARLYQRDGKISYLKDIPLVLNYVLELEPAYPDLANLCHFIHARVLPQLETTGAFFESNI